MINSIVAKLASPANKICVALLTAIFLSGCAGITVSDSEKTQAYQKFIDDNKLESTAQVHAFRLHSWQYLNRDYLIISTAINRPYLIKINGACFELAYAHALGVHRDGASLVEKFDWVFAPGYPEMRCYVQSIYPLTREQSTQLREIAPKLLEAKQAETSSAAQPH